MRTLRLVLTTIMILCCMDAETRGGILDTTIVASGASLEIVFNGAEFTEGPAAGPDGRIYFSDLTFGSRVPGNDGHIWLFDPRTSECQIFRSPSGMSNGIEFDGSGRMIVAQGSEFGGRGLIRIDLSSGKGEILVAGYDGKPLNSPNDLVIDSKGRVFFTDPHYGETSRSSQPVNGVYRYDPDERVSMIIRDVPMPNGIALSPDERLLYVGSFDEGTADSAAGQSRSPRNFIGQYQLAADGSVTAFRTFVLYPLGVGPDGIGVDKAGHVYVAVRDDANPGIAVYNPQGEQISWIRTPEVPSNVSFGRSPADMMLYITAGNSLYRIRTTQHGSFPASW